MDQDLFKLIGILLFSFFLVYLVVKLFNLQANVIEGLTTQSSSGSTSGEAGTSANYADTIKAQTVQLQDSLLISKYRKEYENIILNMEDYLHMLMLKQIVNININGTVKEITDGLHTVNILKNAKDSLDDTIKFVDKQK